MDRSLTDRTLLMIPGPVELTTDVLVAQAKPPLSHVGPDFREVAAAMLARVRELFDAPGAQPVVVAGSGTLAMEIALANLLEPGEPILILETGYFAARFGEIAARLGAEVRIERAPVGHTLDPDRIREVVHRLRPKVVTITHVDTSTGVRVDVPLFAEIAHEVEALVVVDGVCSIGGEEYHGDAWGIEVGLTASQKAIGAPPGLALLTVGPRAREARAKRSAPFTGYFTDLERWFPVMEGYEWASPRYFGTPPVTLFPALLTALDALLAEGLPARVRRHARISQAFKAGVDALSMPNRVTQPESAAHTLTVPRLPAGVGDELVGLIRAEGVTVAGAIHPELRGKTFRVGHMGTCGPAEILTALGAIERAAYRAGAKIALGAGLAAAQRVLVDRE
ncbi:MAG: aminotransferase class V-fold PLP-dependent enzyme [Chloroflexi bacterium]|nr:aminotransferase class V-fold PLP-dependent enzyme [Chloroflexota bacterium]